MVVFDALRQIGVVNRENMMAQDERLNVLMTAFQKTAYFRWMARQGIPIIDGYGVEDVRDIAAAPGSRTPG